MGKEEVRYKRYKFLDNRRYARFGELLSESGIGIAKDGKESIYTYKEREAVAERLYEYANKHPVHIDREIGEMLFEYGVQSFLDDIELMKNALPDVEDQTRHDAEGIKRGICQAILNSISKSPK